MRNVPLGYSDHSNGPFAPIGSHVAFPVPRSTVRGGERAWSSGCLAHTVRRWFGGPGKHVGVTSADGERDTLDVAVLRQAVHLLNERNSPDVELPSPSAEFLLFAMARLLESIATSLERGDEVAPDVRENAERIARHIEHYIDIYLPVEK